VYCLGGVKAAGTIV